MYKRIIEHNNGNQIELTPIQVINTPLNEKRQRKKATFTSTNNIIEVFEEKKKIPKNKIDKVRKSHRPSYNKRR